MSEVEQLVTQHALEMALLREALTQVTSRHDAIEAQAKQFHALTLEMQHWVGRYKTLLARTHAFLAYVDAHESVWPIRDPIGIGYEVLVQRLRDASSFLPEDAV